MAHPASPLSLASKNSSSAYRSSETVMQGEPDWQPPSPELAVLKARKAMFQEGKASCCCGSDDELNDLGPGIALYFMSLKLLGLLFLAMAVVASPVVFIGVAGSQLSEEDKDALYMAASSIANIGFDKDRALPEPSNATLNAGALPVYDLPLVGAFTESDLAMVVTYSVLVNALLFVGFVWWYPKFVSAQRRLADEAVISAADYTVEVRGLPPDATEEQVRTHFSRLYNLWEDDWTSDTCCHLKRTRRIKYQPDTEDARRRWANANATAARHRAGFKRNTANPVMNVDHVLDMHLDPEVADPNGWRRPILEAEGRPLAVEGKEASAESDDESEHSSSESEASHPGEDDPEAGEGPHEAPSAAAPALAPGGRADDGGHAAAEKGRQGAARLRALNAANEAGFDDLATLARASLEESKLPELLRESFPEEGLGERAAQTYASWVADVVLANPNGDLLARYMKVKTLIKQRAKSVSRSRMLRKLGQEKALKKELEKLDKLDATIDAVNGKSLAAWNDSTVIGAFVTFENEESRQRCLIDYSTQRRCCAGLPRPLKFRGKHDLEVTEANEPDDVEWENLEVSDSSRCARQALTACVAAVMLVASLLVVVAANTAKSEFTSTLPATSVCASGLPAVRYGGYDRVPDEFRLVRTAGSDCDVIAANRTAQIRAGTTAPGDGVHGSSATLVGIRYEPSPDPQVAAAAAVASADPRCSEGACWGTDDTFQCATLPSTASPSMPFPGSSVVGCYCIQQFVEAIEVHGANAISVVQQQEGDLCLDLLTTYATAQSLIVGAALLVVVVNMLLTTVLTVITRFERHKNLSDASAALTTKIFVSQFVNTSLIVLLVNAQFQFVQDIGLKGGFLGLFAGSYASFEPKWYSAVGVGICITMLTNVVVPHMGFVTAILRRPLNFLVRRPVDDADMEELYAMPRFDASGKYPVLLNVVFVTVMYCAGLPVLLPIAAAFMFVTYWLERLTLTRCSSRPAYEDAEVAKQIGRLLPIAVILHLCFAVWMLSDPDTLESEPFQLATYFAGTGDAQLVIKRAAEAAEAWDLVGFVPRILRANTFPVFALLVSIIVVRLAYAVVGRFLIGALLKCISFVSCGLWCRGELQAHQVDELIPPFSGIFHQRVEEQNLGILTRLQDDDACEVVTDLYRGKPFKMMTRRFTAEQQAEDWRHVAGAPMRTWQVIEESHTASYSLSKSPKYREAYMAIRSGKSLQAAALKAEEDESQAQAAEDAEMAAEAAKARSARLQKEASAKVLPMHELEGAAAPPGEPFAAWPSAGGAVVVDDSSANAAVHSAAATHEGQPQTLVTVEHLESDPEQPSQPSAEP
ncbi:hypothetical protein FNF28_04847 [Cafeteria roenbergensis]|uniref:CSC1/OSCA1-like 7TM region domain-containing protein n=1 Tax=Cafeteria roenbergensis TaxID=33653 RepID=A0A5A8DDX0_CAFRO|nr:hypothetical protein FNF28_04847 [Cafeteria roenbergensis]